MRSLPGRKTNNMAVPAFAFGALPRLFDKTIFVIKYELYLKLT
jgi:hypothetical protein